MEDIAIGVTVFKRINKLEHLLKSVNSELLSKVYVADDGEITDRKREVYNRKYPFDLTVFDLPFDAGLGYGRNKIFEELSEDYMLLLDSDMEVPHNVSILFEQLESNKQIGGICGLFLENNRISTSCCDLFEEEGAIIKDIRSEKDITFIAEAPFVEFEFISNAAMFRRECLEDYSWDPEYTIGREHIDFYVGHKRETNWTFGLCPEVLFPHHPGGTEDYLDHRQSGKKYKEAEEYFMNKWGYNKFVHSHNNWLDTYDARYGGIPPHTLRQRVRYKYEQGGVLSLMSSIARRVQNTL